MFDVQVEGSEVVIKNLEKFSDKSKNLSSAFKQISSDLLKSHETNFKQQGTSFGSRWPERTQSYAWPLMQKTGKLASSFKGSYNSDSAEVTNTADYAIFHQLGTRRGLPVRNLVGLAGNGGKTDINNAVRTLREHLGLK